MHGDFSRDSHNAARAFTGLLMQQGRLLVDADWNEQTAIILRYLRALAADVIGWHGGLQVAPGLGHAYTVTNGQVPTAKGAFIVSYPDNEPAVQGGHYYVEGHLLDVPFTASGYPVIDLSKPDEGHRNHFIFLDVWERLATAAIYPDLLDPAFDGHDTCVRRELRMAFKGFFTDVDPEVLTPLDGPRFREFVRKLAIDEMHLPLQGRDPNDSAHLPSLKVLTKQDSDANDDCAGEAVRGYTGRENQCYRIEIHRGGMTFWDGRRDNGGLPILNKDIEAPPTFKWSRDNGSVLYRIAKLGADYLTLSTKWSDECRAIAKGHWIELLAGADEEVGVLVKVTHVDDKDDPVNISFVPPPDLSDASKQWLGKLIELGEKESGPPGLVRRWDHTFGNATPHSEGAVLIERSNEKPKEGEIPPMLSTQIPLEDGISVVFRLVTEKSGDKVTIYPTLSGDYWQAPARAAIDGVIWPSDKNSPIEVPARYTVHYYAPVALVTPGDGAKNHEVHDLRRELIPITGP